MQNLINKFNNLNINCKLIKNKKYNLLYFSVSESKKFLEYIGNCPEDITHIYGYKWNY